MFLTLRVLGGQPRPWAPARRFSLPVVCSSSPVHPSLFHRPAALNTTFVHSPSRPTNLWHSCALACTVSMHAEWRQAVGWRGRMGEGAATLCRRLKEVLGRFCVVKTAHLFACVPVSSGPAAHQELPSPPFAATRRGVRARAMASPKLPLIPGYSVHPPVSSQWTAKLANLTRARPARCLVACWRPPA